MRDGRSNSSRWLRAAAASILVTLGTVAVGITLGTFLALSGAGQ